ncbi:MAG: flagellar filament capping protein FliD, partial [Acidimicrobiales bacterium]
NEIMSVFAGGSGTSSLGDVKNAGVSLSKTATLAFTRAVFTAAFATNPTAVEDLFVQGGKYAASATGVASDVAFSFAGTTTAAGTYRVAISQSATQATDTGRTLATGRVSTPESLTVTAGTASATYETTTGESLANVASGLNAAFAGAKLGLSAEVTGERLEIVSSAYGSAASFSVTSTTVGTGSATGTTGLGTATAATFTGTNVAGTIGGLEATGKGQVLSLPAGVQGGGLGVLVTATGISAATPPVTLGTLAYRPGVAQQLSTAMSAATNVATGSITTAIKSLTNQATGLNSQISMYERLEAEQRTTLEKEFTNMETTLSKLKNESSQLTSELAKLKNTSLT